jgi:pimeloyl-ACP methyl ester carboxylesterase
MKFNHAFAAAIVVAGSLLSSGCVSSILAGIAIKAPNQQQVPRAVADRAYAQRFDGLYNQVWRLRVGPPWADLSVAELEPGDYRFSYSIEVKQSPAGWKWLEPKFDWTLPPRGAGAAPIKVKGTILVLHGYRDAKENVAHWALCLAEGGYRCILVDLRGHGRSTGDTIGYGSFEVNDLSRVIDDLQKRGLAPERVGLLGVSYGASMGLLLAAQDHRIGAVVALEPFSNAEHALVEFAHGVAPQQAAKISEQDFASAVSKAAQRGKFSWSNGNVLAAMDRVTIPVLFYHGAKDTWMSPDNSRALQARARGVSRLVILPDDDHVFLSMRLGEIVPDVWAWFDRYLAPGASLGSSARESELDSELRPR